MQHQIAYVAAQIEAVRTLVYNTARRKEAGLPVVKQASMAKFLASEVRSQPDECFDIFALLSMKYICIFFSHRFKKILMLFIVKIMTIIK